VVWEKPTEKGLPERGQMIPEEKGQIHSGGRGGWKSKHKHITQKWGTEDYGTREMAWNELIVAKGGSDWKKCTSRETYGVPKTANPTWVIVRGKGENGR